QRQSYKRRSAAVVNHKIIFFSALFIAGAFPEGISHGNPLSMFFDELLVEKEPPTQTKVAQSSGRLPREVSRRATLLHRPLDNLQEYQMLGRAAMRCEICYIWLGHSSVIRFRDLASQSCGT